MDEEYEDYLCTVYLGAGGRAAQPAWCRRGTARRAAGLSELKRGGEKGTEKAESQKSPLRLTLNQLLSWLRVRRASPRIVPRASGPSARGKCSHVRLRQHVGDGHSGRGRQGRRWLLLMAHARRGRPAAGRLAGCVSTDVSFSTATLNDVGLLGGWFVRSG